MNSKIVSRRVLMDKQRAISTAKNPKESCLGQALLRNNVFEGRLLSGQIGKIGEQSRRNQMHLEQQRKMFLKNHELPEPTIIVNRPPSPEIMRKALFPEYYDDDAYYFDPNLPPHYMKPLNSQNRAPSMHHTMDMFKRKSKKKVNLWEEVLIDKEKPQFESTVKPSYRLSSTEQQELHKGWTMQKRRLMTPSPSRPTTGILLTSASTNAITSTAINTNHSIRPYTSPIRNRNTNSRSSSKATSQKGRINGAKTTFITELPEMRSGDDNHYKSVSFVTDIPSTQEETIQAMDAPKDELTDKRTISKKYKKKRKNVPLHDNTMTQTRTINSKKKNSKQESLLKILTSD